MSATDLLIIKDPQMHLAKCCTQHSLFASKHTDSQDTTQVSWFVPAATDAVKFMKYKWDFINNNLSLLRLLGQGTCPHSIHLKYVLQSKMADFQFVSVPGFKGMQSKCCKVDGRKIEP